jgi:uncharacterized membrane protein YraQ (UPF0718 family)
MCLVSGRAIRLLLLLLSALLVRVVTAVTVAVIVNWCVTRVYDACEWVLDQVCFVHRCAQLMQRMNSRSAATACQPFCAVECSSTRVTFRPLCAATQLHYHDYLHTHNSMSS